MADAALRRVREREIFFRYDQKTWDALRAFKPNLHHLLCAISYEASPEDPVVREHIAAALLSLLTMLDDMAASEQLKILMNEEGVLTV
jgi:hypothetical protein